MGYRWMILEALRLVGAEASERTLRWMIDHLTREGRVDRALREMAALGHISAKEPGLLDERVYRLTDSGRLVSRKGLDPDAEWSRAWDGRWRMVAFDIPETSSSLRVRLRRNLRAHRFGWLQNSVWVSPDPLEQISQQIGSAGINPEGLLLLEAAPVGGENHAAIAEGAWDFDRINRAWSLYHALLQQIPSASLLDATAWRRWFTAEHNAWRQIARHDPFLPRPLHPARYHGPAVWRVRQSMGQSHTSLLPPL